MFLNAGVRQIKKCSFLVVLAEEDFFFFKFRRLKAVGNPKFIYIELSNACLCLSLMMGVSEVLGIQTEQGSSPPVSSLRKMWETEKLPGSAVSALPALPHHLQTTGPTLPPSCPSVPHSRLFGFQRNALCAKQIERGGISTKH